MAGCLGSSLSLALGFLKLDWGLDFSTGDQAQAPSFKAIPKVSRMVQSPWKHTKQFRNIFGKESVADEENTTAFGQIRWKATRNI